MRTLVASSSGPSRPQLPALQILRFLAAFAVVLVHVGSGLSIEYKTEMPVFRHGNIGVDIFFVLSGFIISYTARPEKGFLYFMQRRVARVVPLYWLLTLGLVSVAAVAPFLLNSTKITADRLITSLLFILHVKDNGVVQPILFLGWTLCYEMFFYVIFAIALSARRHVTYVASAIIIAVILAGKLYPGGNLLWAFYTNPILLEFVFGMLIFEAYSWLGRRPANPYLSLALLAAGIAIHLLTPEGERIINSGIPAVFIVSSFLLIDLPASAAVSGLVLLGDASYSLYLAHPYFIQVGVKIFGEEYGMAFSAFAMLVAAGAAVLGSVLLYTFIEKPVQRWILKLGQPRRPQPETGLI